jgi:hypothetical protein
VYHEDGMHCRGCAIKTTACLRLCCRKSLQDCVQLLLLLLKHAPVPVPPVAGRC